MIELVREMGPRLGYAATCDAVGLPRATFYRHARPIAPKVKSPRPRRRPKQALSIEQRQRVLETLHEDRFVDLAPAEIYAQLLDEGEHLHAHGG